MLRGEAMTETDRLRTVLLMRNSLPREARVNIEQCLKVAIETGALAPGTRITQQSVADVFQVSRMPVREALRMLDVQGYVENQPNCGYIVSAAHPRPREQNPAEYLLPLIHHYRLLKPQERSDFEEDLIRRLHESL